MLAKFRFIPRNSLGGQIMSILGVALLTTLILFSLSVFYFVNRTESYAWRGRQSEAARNAAGTVSGFIRRVQDALLVVSIIGSNHLASDSGEIKALLQENASLLEIIRVDSAGHVFASAFRDKSVMANLITIPQSQWFRRAREGHVYIGDVQLSANNVPYLILAVPCSDGGVVAARVEMNVLWETVHHIQFGETGEVVVINRAGKIIAHTVPELAAPGQTLAGRPELSAILNAPNNEWSGAYVDFHNEPVVAATAPVPGTDWIVITEVPRREAFATSRLAIFALGSEAFLLMLVVSLAVVRYVRGRIVEPMQQLSDGADRIGRGKLDHRIDLVRDDEIGQLASAFNTMAADLEKQQENLQKAVAYEYESRRSRELDILLRASEATSSSLDFDTVMHTLASQLLEISGLECCFISEWDKEMDTMVGGLEDSRTFWEEGKRDSYYMSDYPRSHQVLLTGEPLILQGEFESEEKLWMNELKRTAVIILPLQSGGSTIGLVEIASIKRDYLFDQRVLPICQEILANAATRLMTPLSSNDPKNLFKIEEALLQATGAEVCSFSEWDRPANRVVNLAVVTKVTWASGPGTRFDPDFDTWHLALDQDKTITFVRSDGVTTKAVVSDGAKAIDVESLIIFPLQKGSERIGVIELYDFNHRITLTPEQITLLRTIADKASFSIENARLLSQTQKRLDEQIALHNEKEVLLKEIHHRVKNNLQIISSLLNLQASQLTDVATLQALGDSQARVRSMALIHEKLYQSRSLAKIDFGEYVKSLSNDLFRSYRRSAAGVRMNVQVDEVTLGLDQAVSCGLILNELMTNALKYAFPNGREGNLSVELHAAGRSITLCVADDGVGFPPDFNVANAKSLGLQLVNTLVGQLEGKLESEHSNGTAFRVSFAY